MAFISTKFFVVDICQCSKYASAVEAYLEPSRTARMELFLKNSYGLFVDDKNFSSNDNMIFAKRFFWNRYRLLVMSPETFRILNSRLQDSKYAYKLHYGIFMRLSGASAFQKYNE